MADGHTDIASKGVYSGAIRRALVAAEYEAPGDHLIDAAAGVLLAWNGDLDRALTRDIWDGTAPALVVLSQYREALRCALRPELIAKRHDVNAAEIERGIAHSLVTIREKRERIAACQSYDPVTAGVLQGEADRLAASISEREAVAKRLRDRAAEIRAYLVGGEAA